MGSKRRKIHIGQRCRQPFGDKAAVRQHALQCSLQEMQASAQSSTEIDSTVCSRLCTSKYSYAAQCTVTSNLVDLHDISKNATIEF